MSEATMTKSTVRVLEDPARGRRVVHLDGAGRPIRIDFADGSIWSIRRDAAQGRLGIDDGAGARLLSFEPVSGTAFGRGAVHDGSSSDGVQSVRARSAGAETVIQTGTDFQRIVDAHGVLRIDIDAEGDPARVTVPGAPADLVFRTRGQAREIGWLGGDTLLVVDESETTTRVDAGGTGWVQRATRGAIRWSTLAGQVLAQLDDDELGRPCRRAWAGGSTETFERDEAGRLTSWTTTDAAGDTTRHGREYSAAGEPRAVVLDGMSASVTSRFGGRIERRSGPDGASYDHDARGQRTRRVGRSGVERYAYDALGRLTEFVAEDGTPVRYQWDALGRRTAVETPAMRIREHRDATGRLWAVTDAAGSAIHIFVWWRGRPIARTGPDGRLDEIYLTDPAGTLIGVAVRDGEGWAWEECMQPPFGAVGAPWRPTLFGHIADGASRLISFGARDLDPETGCFLTPDPWHGAEDDPRRIAGEDAKDVRAREELPAGGALAYALSRHDPLSLPDFDGHAAWVNGILTAILAPTWGFPLTSVSLFLFEPLNIYMEVFGLFGILLNGGRHPWPQHTLANARWFSGSSRQGTVALSLNGFLPRVITGRGVDTDRAVTIGHVVWIGRQNVNMLNRARVLEVDDVGDPRAPGAPASGGPATREPFTEGSIYRSALAVIATDGDRRMRIQGTWWARGPGGKVAIDAAGRQFYHDDAPAGQTNAPGTIHLGAPLQSAMSGTLEVREFVEQPTASPAPPAPVATTGEPVVGLGFAIDVAGDVLPPVGDVVEVALVGAAAATPAYARIGSVLAPRTVVLDHPLPARFAAAGTAPSYTVRLMTPTATTSPGWTAGASTTEITLATPLPHEVSGGEVWAITPSSGAPAGRADAVTAVDQVRVTVELSPSVSAAALTGTTVSRLAAEALLRTATREADGRVLVKAPPAFAPSGPVTTPPPPLAVGDLLTVFDPATAFRHDARITEIEAAGADSRIRIEPPLPAGTVSQVVRLLETDRSRDGGAVTVQAGDRVTIGIRSTAVFAPDTPVRIEAAGVAQVRRVTARHEVTMVTADDVIGAAPFTVVLLEPAPQTAKGTVPAGIFVEWKAGDLPSVFGSWPGEILAVAPIGFESNARAAWFAIREGSLPAEAVAGFHASFTTHVVEGKEYWRIDLPIKEDKKKRSWEPDREDDYPRRVKIDATGRNLRIWRLSASGTVRPDAGRTVKARAGEVQVPEEPSAHFPLGDALAEHELHHTVQNTYWGPLLGALPIHGLVRTVRDVVVKADADAAPWLGDWAKTVRTDDGRVDEKFADLNWFEFTSIGGIMQLAWTFVILLPAMGSAAAREWMFHRMQFSDWNTVFNPLNSVIARQIPRVDRGVEATRDWKTLLLNLITTATDLRSWMPFVGFVPLMLPDGPQNFLEQQAARASGDLYSTIVSSNDGVNRILTSRCGPDLYPDSSEGNRTIAVGRSTRLMWYGGFPLDRALGDMTGNTPTAHSSFNLICDLPAGGTAYLPGSLFAGGTPVQIETPTGAPAPLAQITGGNSARIRLRATVPTPRTVVRSTGFYLLPASPGIWRVESTSGVGEAATERAVITVTSDASLGADPVPWTPPIPVGAAAVPAGVTTIERFITESQPLTVAGADTSTWEATLVDAPPAVAGAPARGVLTRRAGGKGWDVAFSSPTTAGLGVATVDTRLRIWARIDPADAGIFDLAPDDLPGASRSYLDAEEWLPVRDFIVRLNDLPVLAAASIAASENFEFDVVVKLSGPASIVAAGGAATTVQRVRDVAPRGERWRIQLSGRRAVAEPTDIAVTVSFGDATKGIAERPFTLTVRPDIEVRRSDGGTVFEATPAAPLVLRATGHTGALRLVEQPPAAANTQVVIAGDEITLTVTAPPASTVAYEVLVEDGNRKLGLRPVTIRV